MTDPTNGDLADEIERLDSEATAGPWEATDGQDSWDLYGGVLKILKAPKHGTPYTEYWPNPSDAALIVVLRNRATLIAARLREADALRAEVEALRAFHRETEKRIRMRMDMGEITWAEREILGLARLAAQPPAADSMVAMAQAYVDPNPEALRRYAIEQGWLPAADEPTGDAG